MAGMHRSCRISAEMPERALTSGQPRFQWQGSRLPAPRPDDLTQDVFLTSDFGIAGREPSQTIEVSIVNPPQLVAERLALEPGGVAVVRRRVRLLDGEPLHSNDSYFPMWVAEGTAVMSPADIGCGANQELARLGHVQVRAVDEIFVRMPTPQEVRRLDLSPGTPVAVHVVTGYGAVDQPLRCLVSVLPGDRHVIVHDRPGLPADEVLTG